MQKLDKTLNLILGIIEKPLFWIGLFILIRMGLINEDPFGGHVWRQTITLGVARNYLEWDANFFHPRTILCGDRGGILAQEFPIYNYMIFLGWKIFGEQNWVFRIILLTVNAFGLYWFYRFVCGVLNHRAALSALVLLGCSIVFTYSFRPMPDTFAVSLALGGVWFGWKFLHTTDRAWKYAIACIVLTAIGALSKIPAIVVMTLLLIPFMSREVPRSRKYILAGLACIPIVSVLLWYYVWVPWAERTYMYPLFYPRKLERGIHELLSLRAQAFERFEVMAMQSRALFYLCVTGFVSLLLRRKTVLILTSLLYCIAFGYFMIKAGDVFPTHEYYVIPFVPLLALWGGYLIDLLLPERSRALAPLLMCIAILAIANQWKNFQIEDSERKYHRLEALCDQYIPKDARIMVSNDDANPMMLYFCHRKGWANDELWKNERWIRGQVKNGLDYIVVERFRHTEPLTFPLLYEDEDFLIYKTNELRQGE